MVLAAHLEDWHPWERYQDFFMAKAGLGGGALLDESHVIDLLLWLFGRPREVSATVERLSRLEIETDDNVEINALLDDGVRVSIHLDLYARPHQRTIRIVGTEGTLEWDNEANTVRLWHHDRKEWVVEAFTCERNDMFLAEAKSFLALLKGLEPPLCTLDDGCRVLEVVESVRRSSQERRTIEVPASAFP
jgi:predicted dehydrogenase